MPLLRAALWLCWEVVYGRRVKEMRDPELDENQVKG
jgi:hypothetical protein